MKPACLGSFALLVLVLAACDGPAGQDAGVDAAAIDSGATACAPAPIGDPRAIFVLPRDGSEPLFDLPFPSDVNRTPQGTIDLLRFPNPRDNSFVNRYLTAITSRLRGYATNGAIYFRFSHPVRESSLPGSPEDSLAASASVFLVDIDPASPEHGQRRPVVVHYQECQTRYWSPNTVALRPVYGMPLGAARRYAAVVTTGVLPDAGGSFARDVDFSSLIGTGGDSAIENARTVYGDAFTELVNAGVALDDVLAVTVFTTQDPISETIAIRDWMVANYTAPTLVPDTLMVTRNAPAMVQLTGEYGPVPVFQEGEIPYLEKGGAINLDASGVPIVHGEYNARFTLSIPPASVMMPTTGYPIVLYAHGTGGDFDSFVNDGTAGNLAAIGFAGMGIDQIHHGARNPLPAVDESVLFFNFPNPDSARDNNRQSALDVVQQARVVGAISIPTTMLTDRADPVFFDTSRIFFMGHSQGGLNGPLFLAIDDASRGGVLSAASAVITPALLHKMEPLAIPDVVRALLNLPGNTWEEAYALEGFTEEHPIATLVQTWIEISDGSNYAHMIFAQPRAGFAPKSVLMTEGLLDDYAPPDSIEALAGSMRVPLIEPVSRPVDSLRLLGLARFTPPTTLNVAGDTATAGLLQFPNDGHFAVFRNDVARAQVFGFFESMADGSAGTIPAP